MVFSNRHSPAAVPPFFFAVHAQSVISVALLSEIAESDAAIFAASAAISFKKEV